MKLHLRCLFRITVVLFPPTEQSLNYSHILPRAGKRRTVTKKSHPRTTKTISTITRRKTHPQSQKTPVVGEGGAGKRKIATQKNQTLPRRRIVNCPQLIASKSPLLKYSSQVAGKKRHFFRAGVPREKKSGPKRFLPSAGLARSCRRFLHAVRVRAHPQKLCIVLPSNRLRTRFDPVRLTSLTTEPSTRPLR